MITIGEFKKWLEDKDETETVGQACDGDNCPLAEYIKVKHKTQHVSVGKPDTYMIATQKYPLKFATLPAPEWFPKFIEQVDAEKIERPIIAAEALLFLEFIKNANRD
jgi:hypothetical protein